MKILACTALACTALTRERLRGAWHLLAIGLILAGVAFAQAPVPAPPRPEWHRARYLDLRDPKTVPTRYAGGSILAGAHALSTTTADFDEDGMPDLVAGFATAGGAGAVAIHRGNVDALWPYGPLRGTDPPAFLPDARVFALPEAPDFLAAGDFDADGHWDIVGAHTGSATLYLLKGDGHGGFADAQRIPLPGRITAMTSGEINRADGLTDLMMGVTGPAGPRVLVFECPQGALRGKPEAFDLPAEASALAVTPLDGGVMNGLAVAAGRDLLLIHGRDRRLTWGKAERDKVPVAEVTRQSFPFTLRALAVGLFTSPDIDLAALGDDGQIHILERSEESAQATAGLPARKRTTGVSERVAIAVPLLASGLVTANLAATGRDSLIVLDPAGRRVHLVSHSSKTDATSLALSASLDIGAAPAAVQAMRINKDPLSDLVILASPQLAPIVVETTPVTTLTVTNTANAGPGSLRDTIQNAGSVQGAAEIDFNIPVTDPDRDPTTGVFTIQPTGLYEIGLQPFSELPPLPGGVTLDAYTQPGASPNTLVTGDNAVPLIEIDGSLAGFGANGLTPGGNTIRGMAIDGFVSAETTGNPGGIGIYMIYAFDFIEGNFVGVDPTGTTVNRNSVGVSLSVSKYNNVIGGTTPQARNILTGNTSFNFGMSVYAYGNYVFIQGNYIGTDRTGTIALSNVSAGVDLNGTNAEVGGTTAGAGNLISGNPVDNISVTEGPGFLIQGNYIGTDATGTLALGGGYGIALGETSGIGIGGTTPAARNIISGNGAGVLLEQVATGTTIQGNYIGTDVTGTHQIGNATGISFVVLTQPATGNLIGGEGAGTGNLISANSGAGIQVGSYPGITGGNTITGNLIGTDASGLNPLGNGTGILIDGNAAGNVVGDKDASAINVIAYNSGNGIDIDPGAGVASNNSVIGNEIYSNGGAGVRIPSGTGNIVSQNRIYSNGALGIDIDAAGVQPNSACQANTSGANLLQNAPVLTAGTGTVYVSATATDPNGNTSEFSNCVPASLTGNVFDIVGTLNSKASTKYTVEYFSNNSCDPSGYGQGQSYLGSTVVTTAANCAASLNKSLTLGSADIGVSLTTVYPRDVYYAVYFTATVTNSGPEAASSVTLTDTLPANAAYILATSSQGACGFANGSIACNLGNLPVGDFVTVTIYMFPTATGSFSNTVAVASSTSDANPTNNSASFTSSNASAPAVLSLTPASVQVGSPDTTIVVQTVGLAPSSVVEFGGVAYPATLTTVPDEGIVVNGQHEDTCGGSGYCLQFTITVPASKLTTAGTVQVGVGSAGTLPFNIVTPQAPVTQFVLAGLPNPYPSGGYATLQIYPEDANGNVVTNYTGSVNITSSDPLFSILGYTNPFAFTPGGVNFVSIALVTAGTQSITVTDASNPSITGSLTGIVVLQSPPSNLYLTGTPQAAAPGQAFAQPLTVRVVDVGGTPIANQQVTFTLPTSGPSVILSNATPTTDVNGMVSVTATANNIAGTYSIAVTAGNGTADVFLLNNGTGLATLTATAGTPQSTFLGKLFPTQLQATLLDGLGNPISGANVHFTSAAVNGAYALLSLQATNSSGIAIATANAPENASPGTFTVTASIGGLTTTFTLTEVAWVPLVLTVGSGSPQTTAIGTPFDQPLVAHVADAIGDPKYGAVVTYTVSTSASGATATLSAGSAIADVNGNTSIFATANNTPGTFTVTASVDDMTAPFTLTNGPPQGSGPPGSISTLSGSAQSQTVATLFPGTLRALVKDTHGSPLSGASVTFTAPATGPTCTYAGGGTAVTDINGIATMQVTAGTVAGSYVATATVGNFSTTFSLTNIAGAFAGLAIYAGNNQSATINTNFGTPIAVAFIDAYGNPTTPGVGSNIVGALSIGTGSTGATATTSSTSLTANSQGISTATPLTANGTAGAFTVQALFINLYTYQVSSLTFNLTNTASVPASLTAVSGTPQNTFAGSSFPIALSVKLTDAGSNPLAGFTVSFAGPATGASATLSAASAITNAAGIAAVGAVANGVGGNYSVTASIGPLTAGFGLTNIVPQNRCDINLDQLVNVVDVQLTLNQALGGAAAVSDLNGDGAVNAVDVQIVIDGALGLGCSGG